MRELDEELTTVKESIRDRQRQLQKRDYQLREKEAASTAKITAESFERDIENNKKYTQLLNELDQAKLDILKLREDQLRSQAQA